MTAVSLGINCYTEKPLTWSVREAQLLAKAYAKNPKVVTQMGNQGHAQQGWRIAYELIKGGAIGDVLEFHTWTNRPIWPQGGDRPNWTDPVPDRWIGRRGLARPRCGPTPSSMTRRPGKGKKAKRRKGVYHPFIWRGFVDFGSGALGDMACHTTDGIYAIMEPGYAATAEPIFMTAPVKDQFPAGMTIKMTFRAKADRPGFTTYWYEGQLADGKDNMPRTPEELKSDGRKLPRTGNLIVGTKGKMLVEGDYWDSPRLIPESKMKEFGKPKRLLERSPGHHEEFIQACMGKAARVQPVELRLLGPDDGQRATGEPVARRQEARARRARADHERFGCQRSGLARAAQGLGPARDEGMNRFSGQIQGHGLHLRVGLDS